MRIESPVFNLFKFIFVKSLVVTMASCKTLNSGVGYLELLETTSEEAKMLRSSPDYEKCNPGIHTLFGDVRLNCNLWGKGKLKEGLPYELCTYKKDSLWGWSWQLPNSARGVIGYPALLVGRSPWSPLKAKIAGFPLWLKMFPSSMLPMILKLK